MIIPTNVIKEVSNEKPKLSLANFSDELCMIAETILSKMNFDENYYGFIEDQFVYAKSGDKTEYMFTVAEYKLDQAVGQMANELIIRVDNGSSHSIQITN